MDLVEENLFLNTCMIFFENIYMTILMKRINEVKSKQRSDTSP